MRIAVVGGGVSGLVTAHLLAPEHEVTVFEAGAYAGGHTNTVDVDDPRGPLAVDTGFIVFNDRNYPAFEALLADLGVTGRPTDMGFSVSDEHGRFEYAGTGPGGLFATRRHLAAPRFLKMVAEYARFNRDAKALLASADDPPLLDWLRERRYSTYFVDRLIVPQASAVWSADPAQMATFPARFLVQFFSNHGMLGFTGRPTWHTVTGGSREYVRALLRRLGSHGGGIRLATPVTAVRRDADGVDVHTAHGPERFDEVVLALHSDQALEVLGEDATAAEREVLGAMPYQRNEAVLHTDTRLLPRRRAAWASWNAHLLDTPKPLSTVTYWMNQLQGLAAQRQYLVTLNLTERIDPATVLGTFSYAHPVFTREGMRAQERWAEVSGVRRTHFAGAYWRWGFHEDGVQSAHRVAETLRSRDPEHVAA